MLLNDKGGNQLDPTQSRAPTPLLKHAKHATGIPLHSLNQSCPRLRLLVPDASAHDRPQTADNSCCPHPRARALLIDSRFIGYRVRFCRPTPRPSGGSRPRKSDPRPRRALEKYDARSIAVEEPWYILPPADVCRPRHAIGPRAPTMPTSRKSPLLIDAPLCPRQRPCPRKPSRLESRKRPHC